MPDIRVLVVDDDRVLRGLLVDVINSQPDYSAVGASTLAEAEAAIGPARDGFNAILLDQNLPDGEGGELCERLRRDGMTIPIIIMTGAADLLAGVWSRAMGANDHITKPVRMREVIERIQFHLLYPYTVP
ncbi:response regulator transcription factor [Falsiroseomonas sp. E2-1-a20]|uniref:response regulator transcription factor n=1 Tax=Falsiroseomonas sp. E2-1-a20 TaxID=3239300 RepID=UPI003F3F6786